MSRVKLLGWALLLWLLAWGVSAGSVAKAQQQMMMAEPELITLTLPVGAPLPVVLQEDVSTEYSVPGQPISGFVGQDIYIGRYPVLSQGDRILGEVVSSTPPVKGRNGMLEVRFNTLVLASGLALPLDASVDTGSSNTYWGGELTPGTQPEVVPYHVFKIGSYGRAMLRGEREMGSHIKFGPGSRLRVVLNSPVTVYQKVVSPVD